MWLAISLYVSPPLALPDTNTVAITQAIFAVIATALVCWVKMRNEKRDEMLKEIQEARARKVAEQKKKEREQEERVRAADRTHCSRWSLQLLVAAVAA